MRTSQLVRRGVGVLAIAGAALIAVGALAQPAAAGDGVPRVLRESAGPLAVHA